MIQKERQAITIHSGHLIEWVTRQQLFGYLNTGEKLLQFFTCSDTVFLSGGKHSSLYNKIILYPASLSRTIVIVLLKTPGSTTLPCWFYSSTKWLLLAIFSQSCKNVFSSLYCRCIPWPYYQVYELIACVWQANENAGNLISVVQFSIKGNISLSSLIFFQKETKLCTTKF